VKTGRDRVEFYSHQTNYGNFPRTDKSAERDRRPLPAGICGLFKCVRKLEDAKVVALFSNRQDRCRRPAATGG